MTTQTEQTVGAAEAPVTITITPVNGIHYNRFPAAYETVQEEWLRFNTTLTTWEGSPFAGLRMVPGARLAGMTKAIAMEILATSGRTVATKKESVDADLTGANNKDHDFAVDGNIAYHKVTVVDGSVNITDDAPLPIQFQQVDTHTPEAKVYFSCVCPDRYILLEGTVQGMMNYLSTRGNRIHNSCFIKIDDLRDIPDWLSVVE